MYFSKKLDQFKGVRHCFFSRKNGFSKGKYKGLNCGRGSKDNRKTIQKNLRYVAKKMNVKKNNLILMHQTHSNRAIEIKKTNLKTKKYSDAIFTKLRGYALGVVTADCVPILIYDKKNEVIGCIHAGWRGAFSGVIKNTVLKIKKLSSNNDIHASIGPCIGKTNYEVDLSFFKKFIKKSERYKQYFSYKSPKKKLFNLRKFVADQLLELKVRIDHVNHDTFKEKDNFFSFRRSAILKENDYGRCISAISLI